MFWVIKNTCFEKKNKYKYIKILLYFNIFIWIKKYKKIQKK